MVESNSTGRPNERSTDRASGDTLEPTALVVDGRSVELGPDGHLLVAEDWDERVARAIAEARGVELDSLQWWLIRFVRAHHSRYGMPPLMRIAIRAMREQTEATDASSRTLYRLFPDGPIREACRYAGLPRPESCI